MARPRITQILPGGIKPAALPPYVYWDTTGRGRWVYRHYDPATKRLTGQRLGGPEATLKEIWLAYEEQTQAPPTDTLEKLIDQYKQSHQWQVLGAGTKYDYEKSIRSILSQKTKAGEPVGQTRLSAWTPGSVRMFMDRRGETSQIRANKELVILHLVFQYAYERDLMKLNPARGVKRFPEQPRQRYVTDEEYNGFLKLAGERCPYLVPIMEIAYLCRLRTCEVYDLKRDAITEDGLFAARRKGSKDALTLWTPRLRAAVDAALALHGPIASLYLIPSRDHGRMTSGAVTKAWLKVMVEWKAQGHESFTPHDLKRKGVSDFEGDKLAASGHRSASMLRVYDVLPSKAAATR